ncbi:MAG: 5-oxoprolinase subunit PxpB [Bacteroidia bacterium]|nr:5-oxoprolinase subunit PxpB [Bacteroidia bacterium]MBT8275868.1 5-oxoprolinase subunit PxpB [Bacteroidia bacterium]NNF31242.1 5-oxoprolinase subunit PxpB [Flavobacteriaceae bacterium]NNK54563.1 5-oxoprolinase subunit PxpB [Flavobacteriaceae bacterium]NNM09368.1 5-oxoprolinase subunit PxpB [Flavobacteriaceae bacterium]
MKRTIRKFGNSAVLFEWSSNIKDIDYTSLLSLESYLLKAYSDEILETVMAYTSLAVYFEEGTDPDDFIENFDLQQEWDFFDDTKHNTWVLPVCYSKEFAPDISIVASQNNINEREVIQLHTSREYLVRFIGFLPGFPYLSGLDHRLFTPRKTNPRKLIERGSVGIGGEQTGIYTMDSPGGWNIIGRSPLQFFNVLHRPPSLLIPGDKIQFRSIDPHTFERIHQGVIEGTYELERVNHD